MELRRRPDAERVALEDFSTAWQAYTNTLDDALLPASRANDLRLVRQVRAEKIAPQVTAMRTAMDALVGSAPACAR